MYIYRDVFYLLAFMTSLDASPTHKVQRLSNIIPDAALSSTINVLRVTEPVHPKLSNHEHINPTKTHVTYCISFRSYANTHPRKHKPKQ